MEWSTRSGARRLGTLSLLFLGGVAGAAPPTDVSQLDLTTARQTVTATGLEIEGIQPELGGLKELRRRGRQRAYGPRPAREQQRRPTIRSRVSYGPIASRAALVHRLRLQRTARKNARSLGAIRSWNRLPLKVP